MQPREWGKAIIVGVVTAVVLSLVMVPATRAGISPFPKPLGLAFAQTLLGPVPLQVGLLFHLVYVTLWSVIFVYWAAPRHTFARAFLLAVALWALVLFGFFPVVGWGLLGLAIGPALIVASAAIHLLFAIVLWGSTRLLFRS